MEFKSLIYSRKRRGPRIEPWGTPHVMGKQPDCVLLT